MSGICKTDRAEVAFARDKRKVALKTLRPTRQVQGMVRERFMREAEVLGCLSHPNFVDISDFGESAHCAAYLVMELLHGRSLAAELREHATQHPARALRVLREVASGLAHGLGIIHRDIKLDDIVVIDDESKEGFGKILDLGVAAADDRISRATRCSTARRSIWRRSRCRAGARTRQYACAQRP